MVFSSLTFIFLILPLYSLLDGAARVFRSCQWRNIVLLAVSLLFYIWGEAANVLLLTGMGILTYAGGKRLCGPGKARLNLAFFVAANLAVLIGFKYAAWLASFFVPALAEKKAYLPLGISFFTFHAISYLVDVYRKHIPPAKNLLDFLTYFCMFPHLVAGPIVRYAQVREDLESRGPDRDLFAFGFYRFLVGLNKKVIIANSVAIMADSAFRLSSLGDLSCADAWLGITAYAVQIYFDFSGHSDMAIGLAAMAGFHFEENFKRPYSSASIREFWRRWHISLSSWLRDYLYIPLGGSRSDAAATYRNLLLVFFLCGLWHGANITFVVWGMWHGLFLVFERLPLGRGLEKLPRAAGRCYALLVVLIGWVFFRADSFSAAAAYLADMFSFRFASAVLLYHSTACIALAAGVLICLAPDTLIPTPTSHTPKAFSFASYGMQIALALASVALLLTGARSPFIYFNF